MDIRLENEFQFIEEVSKLELQPSDLLVVKVKNMVSQKQMQDIKRGVRALGIKNRIMVLEETITVGIVRVVKDGFSEASKG